MPSSAVNDGAPIPSKTAIAILSPSLDKRHGTERCLVEQLERLAADPTWDLHVYCQHVDEAELSVGRLARSFAWHKIPGIPGPHLLKFLWWILANHLKRWRDRCRGIQYDLVYSPGVNCLRADVISVHIVFAEFYRNVKDQLRLRKNPLILWPRLIHRRLYYHLIIMLERLVYSRRDVALVAVSRIVAGQLNDLFGSSEHLPVIYHGVDPVRFSCVARERLRTEARQALGIPPGGFVVLLVGNDWKKKGLACLLNALGLLDNPDILLLVVGRDSTAPFSPMIAENRLDDRVGFLPPRPDVEYYYAASDAYAGPSLEDAFALPPLEAMACGLPVIVSRFAGVSELVEDHKNGLVLQDPRNPDELARCIQFLFENLEERQRLGDAAARTASKYTWERNAAEMQIVLKGALRRKMERCW